MYKGAQFGAISASTVVEVAEWVRRKYGMEPWHITSGYDYNELNQPYVWIQGRAGYTLSVPNVVKGVPIKLVIEEKEAETHPIERSPQHAVPAGAGPLPVPAGAGPLPVGPVGPKPLGPIGPKPLSPAGPGGGPDPVTTPPLSPMLPSGAPRMTSAPRGGSMMPMPRGGGPHMAAAPRGGSMVPGGAQRMRGLGAFQQVDEVRDAPTWTRTEVGMVSGLLSLLAGVIVGRLTLPPDKKG